MKKNTLLTAAALAGMMFVGQASMAQQSSDQQGANKQSSSGTSDASSAQSSDQSRSQAQSQSDRGDSAATAGARGQQRAGARGQGSQQMDQKFVECAAAMDQFEIQAAQIAEQQAQDDQIKEFAKQLRQDHEQTSKQLQQVAQQAGIPISQQLKQPQQAMLQELKQMQGQEFDKAYIYGNVAGHTVAVLKFRDAAREAQNPQLKQLAQQTLPKLQQHLRHAQELAQWDEASAQTAGAHERASNPGSKTGTSDANSPGSSSSQTGGTNDTGSGASSDSARGGRSPSK